MAEILAKYCEGTTKSNAGMDKVALYKIDWEHTSDRNEYVQVSNLPVGMNLKLSNEVYDGEYRKVISADDKPVSNKNLERFISIKNVSIKNTISSSGSSRTSSVFNKAKKKFELRPIRLVESGVTESGIRKNQGSVKEAEIDPSNEKENIDTLTETTEPENKEPIERTNSVMNDLSLGSDENVTFEDELFAKQICKFHNTFGAPFTYLNSTDKCYYNNTGSISLPSIGRSQLNTIYANPAIFSICPGKVTYMPGMGQGKKRQEILDTITKHLANSKLGMEPEPGVTGAFGEALYEFSQDYNDYVNRLNGLARTAAIFMGLGEKKMPYGKNGETYRNFDYGYYTTYNRGNQSGNPTDKNSSMFDKFFWQLKEDIESMWDDDQYIHFFLSNEGTTMSENASIETVDSPLEGIVNNSGLEDTVRSLHFMLGGAMEGDNNVLNKIDDDLKALVDKIGATGNDSIAGSLVSAVGGLAKGGKLIVPDMIGDASFEQTTQCSLYFRSLTGDIEDIFLRVTLPTLAILNFALPKQLANNMYGYPYVCKCYQRGIYNSDLCVIDGVNIERGGNDNISWNEAGLPTEIKVSFSIKPLHQSLMAGNGRNPFLFMENGPMLEYLGNLCGIDLNVSQTSMKVDLIENLLGNYFKDTPTVWGRTIAHGLKDKVKDLFTF